MPLHKMYVFFFVWSETILLMLVNLFAHALIGCEAQFPLASFVVICKIF